jgi:transposase
MDFTQEHVRFYIYIEWKRGKSAKEIHQQLLESGETNIPSYTTIWRWYAAFSEGSVTAMGDQPRSGRPKSATTTENVQLVSRLITEMPRLSTRELADDTGLSKDTVRRILTHELGLRKVCSTWVPRVLSQVNKENRVHCAQSIIHQLNSNSMDDCLRLWATENETWILFATRGTKEDNKAWLPKGAPKLQVPRSSLTNQKALLLIAFTGDGKFNVEGVPAGATITADVYTKFVHSTGEKWRTLRSSPTRLSELWWQHDNARPHTAATTMEFFQRRKIALISQSPYSPDLNQCDRWINKALKRHCRFLNFTCVDDVVLESLQFCRSITRDRFISELNLLRDHCQKVIDCNGGYPF